MHADPSNQTIAAIATARGNAAIGIVRLSGRDAFRILDTVFKPSKNAAPAPRRLVPGDLIDPAGGATVDSALAARFPAPHSYSGEDMAEIHTHGGLFVTEKILQILVSLGARPAWPGEFTMRAFANAKLDLTQAEAVNDIIHASNERFLKTALATLKGELGALIRQNRNRLIDLLAKMEVVIEYPDEDVLEIPREEIVLEITEVLRGLEKLTENYMPAQLLNSGPKIAIIGRPNVGKSSIMNQILGTKRAITHDAPGTTRDLVGDWLNVSGLNALIMDTAGIAQSSDPVEMEGVRRTTEFMESADHVLLVLDSSTPIQPEDRNIIEYLKENNKKFTTLVNKSDLPRELDENVARDLVGEFIETSALTGAGISQVMESIGETVSQALETLPDLLLTNSRHKELLDNAINSLRDAVANISLPQDILTIDIKSAANNLGQITGEDTTADLLENIFSNFCVGK